MATLGLLFISKGINGTITSQLSLDNSGMKATGKQLITGSLTVDSPLGFGEQWSASVIQIWMEVHSTIIVISLLI
ncbi:hypothetical protein G9396_09905 [Providencia rettgeri]|nr:hypothetical protein G9396_09905 [Providencia rettgeri]